MMCCIDRLHACVCHAGWSENNTIKRRERGEVAGFNLFWRENMSTPDIRVISMNEITVKGLNEDRRGTV